MNPRRKIGLIGPLSIALISPLAYIPGSSRGEQAGKAAPAAEMRGSDWTFHVTPTGMLAIAHKGVPVISTQVAAWGPKWSWAGADLKGAPTDEGRVKFV